MGTPASLHTASPAEIQARLVAEREWTAFLVLRDGDGAQRIIPLEGDQLPVGRGEELAVALDWDEGVSRLHAELEKVGGTWVLVDDGLSRNGSFVNEERVGSRRRLHDGDVLRFGETRLLFRSPRGHSPRSTVVKDIPALATGITDTQRRVLVALARPFRGTVSFATPATNRQIAEELVLSVGAVKTHLRALFDRFEIDDLPQNQKRLRLVELALQSGIVTDSDLEKDG